MTIHIHIKAEQYFPVVLFTILYKMVLTFESVYKILQWTMQLKATKQYLLSCAILCYAVQRGSNFCVCV